MSRLGRALGSGRLYRLPGNATWFLDWKDGRGQRRRQALSTDRRAAERMRAALINERDLALCGLSGELGQERLLAEIRDRYLEDLALRVSAKQLVNVTANLRRMLASIRARRVRDVDPVEITRHRAARLRAGVSHRTVNVEVGSLKAMLRWAAMAGLIADSPLRNLARLPYREEHLRHVRRALTDDEIERFLAAAEHDDADCAARQAAQRTIQRHTRGRHYAARERGERVPQALLWRTLIETGARWGEIGAVTWADLDRERMTLTLRAATTKSGRSRVIPLRRELVEALWKLREVHQRVRQRVVQPGDRVFLSPEGAALPSATTGMRRIFRRVLDRAGIARVDTAGRVIDIHGLRHTAASRMARAGVPLTVTQRVLGHSDPALTARVYTHLDVEDLRQAVVAVVGMVRRA